MSSVPCAIIAVGVIIMINKAIVYMREASGLKQKELAAKLSIAQSTLSGYELGTSEPNYEMVERIANICDFDLQIVDRNSREIIYTEKNIKK